MERTEKVYHSTKNFLFKYFLAFIWIGFNFVVFCKAFSNYHHEPEYYYLSKILGNGLCISRATAPILNLTMVLITLPVCRTLNVLLNTIFGRWSVQILVFYLEKIKALHMTLGVGLIIIGSIHTLAHMSNIYHYIEHYDSKLKAINWATGTDDSILRLLLATPTGFSGCVMLGALFVIAYFSRRHMRERFYNSFLTSHHLFLLFYGMMFYHPLSNIIKHQTNLKAHPNGCDTIDEQIFRNDSVLQAICKEEPVFGANEKMAWIWPLLGLSVYVIDVTYRYLTAHSEAKKVTTLQAYILPGGGTYLKLQFNQTKRVAVRPGQFVLLQCPIISTLEWHPFTVVDFPTAVHNSISLVISDRGDWTHKLYEAVLHNEHCKRQNHVEIQPSRKISFLLSGPHPSPMVSILKYKRIVYIGAGVGITPFAGMIRHLLNYSPRYTSRIHLIWMVKNVEMFTWFADDIIKLQERFWKQNKPDRFTLKFFWTENYNQNLVEEYFTDYPTLRTRIYKGRPVWEELFLELITLYPKKAVTVFSCGPKNLTKDIKIYCRQYGKHACKITHLHAGFG
ncbi:NADPH oxidase 4-like [Wyeomyia smithii]|uniref:NADPH oxidase 4-like n=1 Tax=Wyeomyia smithii TaxID=174621 RepID=UPI0024681151|nr:NADPH oxidase 4-like [Wyeomyia smithii]